MKLLIGNPTFYALFGLLTVFAFFQVWIAFRQMKRIRAMVQEREDRLAMEVSLPPPNHSRWTLILSQFQGARDGVMVERHALGFKLDEKGEDFALCVEISTGRVHIGSGPHMEALDDYGALVVGAYRKGILAKIRKVIANNSAPPEPTVKAEESAQSVRRQEIEIMHEWLGAYGKFISWVVDAQQDEDRVFEFTDIEVKEALSAIAEKTRTRLKELGQ